MAKIDRKKLLKEPDEFLTLSGRAIKWAQGNLRLLTMVAAGVVVLGLAGLGLNAYLEYRQGQASVALGKAFVDYSAYLSGKDDSKTSAQAIAGLEKVAADYGSTPAGHQARLALGGLLMDAGDYAKAAQVLASLADEPDLVPALAPLAWHGLAQAQEAAGKYGEAAASYERAISLAGPAFGASYQMDRARALEAAGDKEAALKIYRQVLGSPPDGESVQTARTRMVALGVEPTQP